MKHQVNDTVCLNFQGSKGNNVVTEDGTCFNLMAMHGHDVHVVCFQQNQREDVRCMEDRTNALTAESGMHFTNYLLIAIDSHPMDSRFGIAGDIAPTVTSKLVKGSADGPLVLVKQ